MKKYTILVLVYFTLSACIFKSYDQSYETTVQLVDMDDKPLKNTNIKVRLFIGNGSHFDTSSTDLRETLRTNTEGNATFKYFLNISDSSVDGASFLVDHDSIWMPVAGVVHTVGNENKNKTAKQVLKIQMDKLRDIKIRVQKKSTTPYNLEFITNLTGTNDRLYDNSYAHVEQFRKNTFSFYQKNVGLFDSIFMCKAYTKGNSTLQLQMTKDSFPLSGGRYIIGIETKYLELTKTSNRDSTFQFILEK